MYKDFTKFTTPIRGQAQNNQIDPGFTYPDMNVPAIPPSNNTVIDPGFSVYPEGTVIDPDFSVPPNDTVIDPGFSVPPNDTVIDPGFSVPPNDTVIDPDFSVPPNDTVIDPGFSVPPNPPFVPGGMPPIITVIPQPIRPCLFCSANQWMPAAVRFLNGAVGYNEFTIYVGNQLVYTGLGNAEITRYTRVNPGFQTITIQAANGYVFLQKSVYFGDGMSTIAIVNSDTTIDVITISDIACATNAISACIRVCNLAPYTGSVNVLIGSIIYSPVEFEQVTNFSNVRNGSYRLYVTKSQQPTVALINTSVNLNANRIYTVYVLNWNSAADTIQTLLVEDRRN